MSAYHSSNYSEERNNVLSVAQLNRYVSQVLDQQVPMLWIRGEISNFTAAASGHWYFSLKDDNAAVRGVMFRGRAAAVDFRPQNGVEVEVYGRVTLYEPRGDYQLQVEQMRRAGLGNLYEAFLRIKERLAQEGLLDNARKKPLPYFVQTIGVVTSLGAAALHDVLTAIRRRAPYIRVIIYPSLVQGKEAPAALIEALQQADTRQEVDVLLLVRGGGSIEDLWAFNDEQLARVIAQMSLPVVSGVGHETDFTIADFVADVRAPTPTAAAELVSVTTQAWQDLLSQNLQRLSRQMERQLQMRSIRVDRASARLVSPQQRLQQFVQHQQFLQQRLHQSMLQQLRHRQLKLTQETRALYTQRPQIEPYAKQLQQLHQRMVWLLPQQIAPKREQLQQLQQRLSKTLIRHLSPQLSKVEQLQSRLLRAMPKYLLRQQSRLQAKADALTAYNPRAILKRGYSITYDAQARIVRQSSDAKAGQPLRVELANGSLDVVVLAEQK